MDDWLNAFPHTMHLWGFSPEIKIMYHGDCKIAHIYTKAKTSVVHFIYGYFDEQNITTIVSCDSFALHIWEK